MKKLILILVILATLYWVAVFQFPEIADKIWAQIGMEEINQNIRNGKETYDNVVTDIPSKDEVIGTYWEAFSGAIDLGANIKDKIDVTKDKIDTVRDTLSEAENTYNEVKGTIEEAKEFIDTTSEKIEEVKWTIDKVSEMWDKLWEVTELGNDIKSTFSGE